MPWHPEPECTSVPITSQPPTCEGSVALLRPPKAAGWATSVGSSYCPDPLETQQATDKTQTLFPQRAAFCRNRSGLSSLPAGTDPAQRCRAGLVWPKISPFTPLAWGGRTQHLKPFVSPFPKESAVLLKPGNQS